MSFGKEANTQPGPRDDPPPAPPKRSRNVHWLRGGLLTLALSLVNFINFLVTGKSLPSRTTGHQMGPGGAMALSVGALIFGVIAIMIHFRKAKA